MKLKSIITVSGHICAGKSFATKMIQSEYGFPIASFGGYLKFYCEKNGLPTDRKTLQDTGETLVKADSKKFLVDVLSHFIGGSDSIILEGVRHQSIFENVKELTENRLAVFIEADLETRYKRYFERNKNSDGSKTFEQFKILNEHSVEMEIEFLKPLCNFTVDSTMDYWIELKNRIETLLLSR